MHCHTVFLSLYVLHLFICNESYCNKRMCSHSNSSEVILSWFNPKSSKQNTSRKIIFLWNDKQKNIQQYKLSCTHYILKYLIHVYQLCANCNYQILIHNAPNLSTCFTSSNITANVNTKKSVVLTILYCNMFCIIDLYKACPCLHLSDQYEYHIHSQYTGTITDNCIK